MVLDTAIAELEAVDVDALSDAELHRLVGDLFAAGSRLGAVRARVLAAWDGRRVWANNGSKAAAARLVRDCDLSGVTARREVRRARKLAFMPATTSAVGAGKLSLDKADLLAAAHQHQLGGLFERDETLLVDQIQAMWFPDAERVVRYWVAAAHDEADITPEACRREGRHFAAVRSFAGTVEVFGSLDPVAGTAVLEELDRLEQQLFEADWATARAEFGPLAHRDQLPRTPPQRRADALVEMAHRSRSMPVGARLPRPLITVLAGYGAFGRLCELADGTPITPQQIIPLLGEADIERIVFDGPSEIIDVGVRERFFTGALRRAIEVRDRHCQHRSGCTVPATKCHVDHIIPYPAGGPTTQHNGRLLCPVHNRQRNNQPRQRPPPEA